MHAKPFTIAAALVFLASCDAPTEMSDMRTTVEERLTTNASDAPAAGGEKQLPDPRAGACFTRSCVEE